MSAAVRAAAATTMSEGRTPADTRETDGDGGAFSGGTADGDRSTMLFNDFLHRRETESRSCLLRGEERFEHLVHNLRWNRNAIVLDENLIFQPAAGPVLCHVNGELAAEGHRFAGILNNTQEDLLQLCLIPSHWRQDRCVLFRDMNSGDFEIGGHDSQCTFDDLRDADQAPIQLQRFGEIQNLI